LLISPYGWKISISGASISEGCTQRATATLGGCVSWFNNWVPQSSGIHNIRGDIYGELAARTWLNHTSKNVNGHIYHCGESRTEGSERPAPWPYYA
jgi:hypothetical protein